MKILFASLFFIASAMAMNSSVKSPFGFTSSSSQPSLYPGPAYVSHPQSSRTLLTPTQRQTVTHNATQTQRDVIEQSKKDLEDIVYAGSACDVKLGH